jgi:hypothetical protein
VDEHGGVRGGDLPGCDARRQQRAVRRVAGDGQERDEVGDLVLEERRGAGPLRVAPLPASARCNSVKASIHQATTLSAATRSVTISAAVAGM